MEHVAWLILSTHVGGKWIMRGLAAALAVVGLRVLALAFRG